MTIALTAFGAALFGAVVGGVATLLVDLWRRALDGVAAARLIRLELMRNQAVVKGALAGQQDTPPLTDAVWTKFAIALTPMVKETPLLLLQREMAIVPVIQNMVSTLGRHPVTDANVRAYLTEWEGDLRDRCRELLEIESTPKRVLMLRLLLRGRPDTADELRAAFEQDLPAQTSATGEPSTPEPHD